PLLSMALGLTLLGALYVIFMLLGPIIAVESTRTKVLLIGGYWLTSWLLFPLIGAQAIWLWLLVVALLSFTGLPLRVALIGSAIVVVVQCAITVLVRFEPGSLFAPGVTLICAATFLALGTITRSSRSLQLAHQEIARLAVVEERARFSRDLHDVLGHSLTVVAVKSDLARRLIRIDPDKAEAEMADIENMARGALSDLRLAVANYRELSLETELLAARTALSAAGISAHLPESTGRLDESLDGAFAWVLREGVTNVIRHSGAGTCWVSIGRSSLTVADDGRGSSTAQTPLDAANSNGLRGLRERMAAVGASLIIGQSHYGGFELTARRTA
ncbi:MAG: sensor histidine kinase, partial [Lacisediminihabitans sp.]